MDCQCGLIRGDIISYLDNERRTSNIRQLLRRHWGSLLQNVNCLSHIGPDPTLTFNTRLQLVITRVRRKGG